MGRRPREDGGGHGGSGSKPANTKDSQEPTEAGRGAQDRSLLRASEATGPAHTSSSDSGLRTVSARMSTALSSQSVVLHYSCPRTPVALQAQTAQPPTLTRHPCSPTPSGTVCLRATPSLIKQRGSCPALVLPLKIRIIIPTSHGCHEPSGKRSGNAPGS